MTDEVNVVPPMPTPMEFHNFKDAEGNPAGGYVEGLGLKIEWQNGPRRDATNGDMKAPNGAFVEDAIVAALKRIEFYQESKFRCIENELAADHLRSALSWLNYRTKNRETKGVEGTHAA